MRGPSSLLALSLLSVGCSQGEPPREVRVEVPTLITSRDPVSVHVRAIQQNGTPRAPGNELALEVTPADLVTMGKRGMLSCQRSGEGSVFAKVAGVEGRAKFSCQLVARLEAPTKLTLDVAAGEVDAPIQVLDEAGKELELPISVTSDLGSVVQARSGRLLPRSVGRAKLTARAGNVSQAIEVEVVRSLKPEAVLVSQDRRIYHSLEPGKYRLTVQLPAAKPLSVEWIGAPYCAYRGNGSEHRADCTLQSKGGVSFDNPAFLLRGERAASLEGVTLQEVP